MLSFLSDKAKLFPENFSKNFILDDSGISLPSFSSRTNLKLLNIIPVTRKIVKRSSATLTRQRRLVLIVFQWWFWRTMSLNFYIILVGLFNIYLKESCFPGCWKASFVVPVFKKVERNVQRKSIALLAFIPWLVKSLKNLEIIVLLITSRKVDFSTFPLWPQVF